MLSYKPLWFLLVARGVSQAELRKQAGFAPNTLTKMKKNEPVSLQVLSNICEYLNVSYGDIIEYIPQNSGGQRYE